MGDNGEASSSAAQRAQSEDGSKRSLLSRWLWALSGQADRVEGTASAMVPVGDGGPKGGLGI